MPSYNKAAEMIQTFLPEQAGLHRCWSSSGAHLKEGGCAIERLRAHWSDSSEDIHLHLQPWSRVR
jgi:hypothetical protein